MTRPPKKWANAIPNANATGLGNAFQTCGHIDTIAEDVVTVDHHIPDIDPNAELDPFLLRHVGVSLSHFLLDIDGAADRVHDAAELSQQPVANVLDNPPTVLSNFGINQAAEVVLKPSVRSLFVQASQAAVASDVSRQDGCQPAFYALRGQREPPVT